MFEIKPWRKPKDINDALGMRDYVFALEDYLDEISHELIYGITKTKESEGFNAVLLELRDWLDDYLEFMRQSSVIDIISFEECPWDHQDLMEQIALGVIRDFQSTFKGFYREKKQGLEFFHRVFRYMEKKKMNVTRVNLNKAIKKTSINY